MIRKDEGVVLRSARSGETSRLVTFLGRQSGKVRLLAKGALTERSPFRGSLEPGSHVEVVYYFREGRTRYYVREVHVHSALETELDSLGRLGAALAVLELLDGVCYWESPEPRIVDLVLDYLACPAAEDPVFLFLAFELKLLAVLGAVPDFSSCLACGAALDGGFFDPEQGECACPRHSVVSPQRIALDADLLSLLGSLDGEALPAAAGRKIAPDLRKRLGSVLHWTYTFHVQNYRLPESLKLLPKE